MPLGRKLRLPGRVVSAVVYALIFTVALWAGAEIPPVTVALSVVVSFVYDAFTLAGNLRDRGRRSERTPSTYR
jgi:hypothetical protein